RRDHGHDSAAVLSRGLFPDGREWGDGDGRRTRPVPAGQPGADAGALRGNDSVLAVRRDRAGHAGGNRRDHVHLSRAPRRRTGGGRSAAVRDVMDAALAYDRPLVPIAPPRRRAIVSLVEIVREACYGLYHHRFRAALSMLGISWGIISVVVLLAYGDGFRGA